MQHIKEKFGTRALVEKQVGWVVASMQVYRSTNLRYLRVVCGVWCVVCGGGGRVCVLSSCPG